MRCLSVEVVELLCLTASIASVCLAAEPSKTLSDTEMQVIVKNAKIIDSNYPLRIALKEQEALVSTQRDPKSTDDDCKIDAILIAKALMEAYPTEILRVKVLFNDYKQNKATQAVVTKGEIKSFGARQIDTDTLLHSLEYSTISSDSQDTDGGRFPNDVTPGIFPERRMLLLGHINILQKQGTNTKPFRIIFEKIEQDVRSRQNEKMILNEMKDLGTKLREEDELIQQAFVIQQEKPQRSYKPNKNQRMRANNSIFSARNRMHSNLSNSDPWQMLRKPQLR